MVVGVFQENCWLIGNRRWVRQVAVVALTGEVVY
jgi:hypothetical protein